MADDRSIVGAWYRPMFRLYFPDNRLPRLGAGDGFPEVAGAAGLGGASDSFSEGLEGGDGHGDDDAIAGFIDKAHGHEALPIIIDYAANLRGIGPFRGKVAHCHFRPFLSVWARIAVEHNTPGACQHG